MSERDQVLSECLRRSLLIEQQRGMSTGLAEVAYSPSAWFGQCSDAERMRFLRAIPAVETAGLVSVKRAGNRVLSLRLTPEGKAAAEAVGDCSRPAPRQPQPSKGLTCPLCGMETTVIRTVPIRGEVTRRRKCDGCGERFSTAERIIGRAGEQEPAISSGLVRTVIGQIEQLLGIDRVPSANN